MTPLEFVYTALPARVVFGAGRIDRLCNELQQLGVERALLICTPRGRSRYAPIADGLGTRCIGLFAGAQPHCPEPVAGAALGAFRDSQADGIVTIGGGSSIGLGKYIAAKTGRPFLAVPTTFSGSEMTALYGVKIGLEKRTWVDPAAKPRAVIYDPELIATLPLHEAATTGMNGLAHCVEALYPAVPNPIARVLALEGIAAFAHGLRGIVNGNNALSRAQALYGGFIGGLLVSMVGIGLHHRICHVLGGHFGVPHGETNSVMLPQVIAFNAPALGAAASDIARVVGGMDAGAALFDLARAIGAPASLRELGMDLARLDDAARVIVDHAGANPRPVDLTAIRALLDDSWHGRAPRPA